MNEEERIQEITYDVPQLCTWCGMPDEGCYRQPECEGITRESEMMEEWYM